MTIKQQACAISCQNLSKRFGPVSAVSDVSLTVPAGSFTALLGPSGCGKTTVLRLLAGLERPDSGNVVVGSRIVAGGTDWVPPEERNIGMVFQEYALFPHLNVQRNVAFGLRGHSDAAARVAAVLKLVQLESMADRSPHALSGGQQQRVALARALAPQPDVILLDEPFSNLDAALRQQVRSEVRAILRQTGVTAVFVTHDQEEALSLADRIAVMIGGKILQEATPRDLYETPACRTVATFLGAANFLSGIAAGATATCELGTIALKHPAQGQVSLMIRPENIMAREDPQGQGVVRQHAYLGHSHILQANLDSGAELTLRLPTAIPPPTIGARIKLETHHSVIAYTSQ